MNNNKKIARKTSVKNELGMHARPASQIAQIASLAQSEIRLSVDSSVVDATSIIDILTLGAVKGTTVEVQIETLEDMTILDQIIDFFEDGFGEA